MQMNDSEQKEYELLQAQELEENKKLSQQSYRRFRLGLLSKQKNADECWRPFKWMSLLMCLLTMILVINARLNPMTRTSTPTNAITFEEAPFTQGLMIVWFISLLIWTMMLMTVLQCDF
jgi:hypothetical protein